MYVSILVFVEVALGPLAHSPVGVAQIGFNPCFRGSRPRTSVAILVGREEVLFQSLFSWKSPSDSKVGNIVLDPFCWFQSLFSWKSPSDIKDALSKQLISLFQSLFSWKSPSDGIRRQPDPGRGGFNPCFRGSRPRTVFFTS